jgi:dTDP-4-dehydrorhamnose reductase
MKILLTGKNGQVGCELRRSLALLGDVVAVGGGDCDLRDPVALRRLIKYNNPHVIVNAAAYTKVDNAEIERDCAYQVNAVAPEILAEEANKIGAILVHYSTDYVFSGSNDVPYIEEDMPLPLNIYGATKLAGENAVRSVADRYLILRTSWVYGVRGNNFPKTILRLAGERESINIVSDQFGAPTSANVLADLTAYTLRDWKRNPNGFPYGLYHSSASGITNWYEYACYVLERARGSCSSIKVKDCTILPITSLNYPTAAKRPLYSKLDTTKLSCAFDLWLPDWKVSLNYVLDQIL